MGLIRQFFLQLNAAMNAISRHVIDLRYGVDIVLFSPDIVQRAQNAII